MLGYDRDQPEGKAGKQSSSRASTALFDDSLPQDKSAGLTSPIESPMLFNPWKTSFASMSWPARRRIAVPAMAVAALAVNEVEAGGGAAGRRRRGATGTRVSCAAQEAARSATHSTAASGAAGGAAAFIREDEGRRRWRDRRVVGVARRCARQLSGIDAVSAVWKCLASFS